MKAGEIVGVKGEPDAADAAGRADAAGTGNRW